MIKRRFVAGSALLVCGALSLTGMAAIAGVNKSSSSSAGIHPLGVTPGDVADQAVRLLEEARAGRFGFTEVTSVHYDILTGELMSMQLVDEEQYSAWVSENPGSTIVFEGHEVPVVYSPLLEGEGPQTRSRL